MSEQKEYTFTEADGTPVTKTIADMEYTELQRAVHKVAKDYSVSSGSTNYSECLTGAQARHPELFKKYYRIQMFGAEAE